MRSGWRDRDPATVSVSPTVLPVITLKLHAMRPHKRFGGGRGLAVAQGLL